MSQLINLAPLSTINSWAAHGLHRCEKGRPFEVARAQLRRQWDHGRVNRRICYIEHARALLHVPVDFKTAPLFISFALGSLALPAVQEALKRARSPCSLGRQLFSVSSALDDRKERDR